MTRSELADTIEIIPERLYWLSLQTAPKDAANTHYFSIDNELIYEPFYADFGPLNIAKVHRYCGILEAKLADPTLADKRIIHYCSHDPKKRANAACLIGAYQVIVRGKTAEQAYEPFKGVYPPFLPFRDASCSAQSFPLTVVDCLAGLQKGIENRWFDWNSFDVDNYEFREKTENGDMNWVIPGKFLAFAGPSPASTDVYGLRVYTPEDYAPVFREAGVNLVVRLNQQQYDKQRFVDKGLKHVDLIFPDGSCPSKEVISTFFQVTEKEQGGIAVHCKAGLGRTGTLIGLYAMKHYHFPAKAFLGWIRLCRPGSILGPQQKFLVDMQAEMFQAGAAMSIPPALLSFNEANVIAEMAALSRQAQARFDHVESLVREVEKISFSDRLKAEQYEDVGQGERLCNAKRSSWVANVCAGKGAPLDNSGETGNVARC